MDFGQKRANRIVRCAEQAIDAQQPLRRFAPGDTTLKIKLSLAVLVRKDLLAISVSESPVLLGRTPAVKCSPAPLARRVRIVGLNRVHLSFAQTGVTLTKMELWIRKKECPRKRTVRRVDQVSSA